MKIGDYFVIQKPKTIDCGSDNIRWVPAMDNYVGQIAMVTSIEGRENEEKKVLLNVDGGRFVWKSSWLRPSERRTGRTFRMLLEAIAEASANPGKTVFVVGVNESQASFLRRTAMIIVSGYLRDWTEHADSLNFCGATLKFVGMQNFRAYFRPGCTDSAGVFFDHCVGEM